MGRGRGRRTIELRERARAILAQIHPATVRGVAYRLFSEGAIPKLSRHDEQRLLRDGAGWAVSEGYGRSEDLSYMEEGGRLATADAELVSERALERGLKQVGTLGSGNHFLEIGRVEAAEVADYRQPQCRISSFSLRHCKSA